MNIAVFCSGNGSNFQAIIDAAKKNFFKAKITLMVCDNPNAYAIKRAEKEKIKTFVVKRDDFSDKEDFEKAIIAQLKKENIGLICLAGYMRIFSPAFVKRYKNRIINIHPALLPSFKGKHGIKDALGYGVKLTGVTVHLVNEDVDAGPAILQQAVKIAEDDTEESLAEKIHRVEHRLYPAAIKLFLEGRLKVIGGKIKITTAVIIFFLLLNMPSDTILGNEATAIILPKADIVERLKATAQPTADNGASNKRYLMDKTYYDKLGLLNANLYDVNDYTYPQTNQAGLLELNSKAEKVLSKEELEEKRIEGSINIAESFAKTAEAMDMGLIKESTDFLVDNAKKLISFRNYMDQKYNLHFKIDKDAGFIRYKRKF